MVNVRSTKSRDPEGLPPAWNVVDGPVIAAHVIQVRPRTGDFRPVSRAVGLPVALHSEPHIVFVADDETPLFDTVEQGRQSGHICGTS